MLGQSLMQVWGSKRRRSGRVAIGVLLITMLAGCQGSPRSDVDLLLYNGTILTLDAQDNRHQSIAVTDGQIVALGDNALSRRYKAVQSVDLQGRTVMPGFYDTHVHVSGDPEHYVDLTQAQSVAEIVRLVAAKLEQLPAGSWITGYGWSEDQLAERRKPSRLDLDAVALNNPVVLTRAGAHSAVANSLAMQRAGFTKDSADPEGGQLERDADGELNGIIRERQDILLDLVPPSTDADVRASFVTNLKDFFRHGITSIVQAIDNTEHYSEWERVYATYPKQLPRASVQLNYTSVPVMRAFNRTTGSGDEWLRVGPIKVMVDGGFTGPAAYTTKPYKDQGDYRGKLNLTEEALAEVINQAHDDGWQLGIHAIGDAAIELTVAQLVKTLERNPRDDHRHYLNHFTVMPSADTMKLMAANGIAITQQPNFTYTLEGRYAANLDGQRLATNNSLRSPMNHGVHLALSSDILPISPAVGLFAATTRQGASGAVYGFEERLTILEALRGYTIKGAFLTREERIKGTLEVDKLADLVVLGSNPLEGKPEDLLQLDVQQTYLGGRLVYNKSGE